MNIGFIGYGEVGYELSKGINSLNEEHNIYAFDPFYDHDTVIQRAEEARVNLYSDPIKVAQEPLDILFVGVPASNALDAWRSIGTYINNRTAYVDLSTASAEIKKHIHNELKDKGASSFIDGAIMGPLRKYQQQVPINISGVKTEEFISQGNILSMNLSYVSNVVGDATNIKFIRSIFTKGLSTLLYEVMEMAELLNLEETIQDSLTDTMDKDSFEEIMNRLITGNVPHAERRINEMDNVIDFINGHDKDSIMTQATRGKLKFISEKNLKKYFNNEMPSSWLSVIKAMNNS